MPRILLKRWDDWSAGVGFLTDDGKTPGLYYASGILGLKGELRPAPFKNTVTVGIDEAYHYQYFFEEPLAQQIPTFDANSSGSITAASTITVSHTVANQPNRVLLVWVHYDPNSAALSGVTYNGVAMTSAKNKASTNITTALYYLVAPTTGANNIVATFSTTQRAVLGASSYYNAAQTSPLRALWGTSGSGTAVSRTGIDSSTNEILVDGMGTPNSLTVTHGGGQTETYNAINADVTIRGAGSRKTGAASATMSHTISGAGGEWTFVGGALTGSTPGPSYLYGLRGGRAGNTPCYLEKLDLANNTFATLEAGSHTLTHLLKAGQPTRYQGFWWLPNGDDFDVVKLTVGAGAVSADTLGTTTTAWAGGGADHLGNMNGQMIRGLALNGYSILPVDGNPLTQASWGSYFPVGDKNERPAATSGLGGLSFVLTVEGLMSFNSNTRSGLVFEDFRSWRNVFDSIPMPAWKGGLLIPHPTGLLYYTPGEIPINVGVEVKGDMGGLPPTGATELHGGRYMGVHATGDYVWAAYQPLLSSTSALIMCAYSRTRDPRDLTWQVVGSTTLNDAQHLLGVFVAAQSQPLASTYYTPTAWFGDGTNLSYLVLDQRAGPFRSRADTHRVVASGNAFMSEVFFPVAVDLDEVVVEAQDMASGDEWQISLIVNNSGTDVKVGAPITASGRHKRDLKSFEGCYRVMLHASWTATSTSARVPPTLKVIELYGNPTNA